MSLDPISAVSDFLTTAVNKIFPDATQRAQAQAALAALKETDDFQSMQSQLKINLADAMSGKPFQAYWRPALAWCCVASFVYHFLLYHFLVMWLPKLQDIASSDFGVMMGVLTVLIGARTYDKSKGTDSK